MRGYVSHRDDEVETFARAVLLDLDAAGALADFLDERDPPTAPYLSGRPSPSRGILLRRRWQQWKKQRAESHGKFILILRECQMPESVVLLCDNDMGRSECESVCDDTFRNYIRSRFIVPVRTR